ncbi:hypothetical protein [Streptomyces sp. Z26]|uniref:hypothetical protein n=1 Tax=Streptomyces sp. Z26 TaxID=2500177 RepID=UPI000EF13C2C|nr:hypothetical protein [Streptomyces sp. Z26]RLL66640.1 hypothetical protein D7M15_06855 [Streptomyces sp. Z26]
MTALVLGLLVPAVSIACAFAILHRRRRRDAAPATYADTGPTATDAGREARRTARLGRRTEHSGVRDGFRTS